MLSLVLGKIYLPFSLEWKARREFNYDRFFSTYKENHPFIIPLLHICKIFRTFEQKGNIRAEYGKAVLADLSTRLTDEFGNGFDERELRRIRQFYLVFPKWDALRPELTWTRIVWLLSGYCAVRVGNLR